MPSTKRGDVGDSQCPTVPAGRRLSVEVITGRFSRMADGLHLFSELASGWDFDKDP